MTGDEVVREYVVRVQYPDPHPLAEAGWLLLDAGSNPALAARRAEIHRQRGAQAQVFRRWWEPTPWQPVDLPEPAGGADG